MRITSTPATEVETTEHDGYTTTVTPDGTVDLGGSIFHVQRLTIQFEGQEPTTETHLIGARGSLYLLRPFLERNGDTGIRQVISLNTGAPFRKRGNEVRVVEIAGVIEVVA